MSDGYGRRIGACDENPQALAQGRRLVDAVYIAPCSVDLVDEPRVGLRLDLLLKHKRGWCKSG